MNNPLFVVLYSLEKGLAWLLKSRLRFILLWFFRLVFWVRSFLPGRRKIPLGRLPSDFNYEFSANAWFAGSTKGQTSVQELELKLWSGFSVVAEEKLKLVTASLYGSVVERGEASWALARRYFASGDYSNALRFLEQAAWLQPVRLFFSGYLILRFETLLKLKCLNAARDLLLEAEQQGVTSNDLLLAWSNWHFVSDGLDTEQRLEPINRILTEAGLLPISLKDETQPLKLANLSGVAADSGLAAGPKVSVLIPVYNAASTLAVAVEGLLNQTWQNLEILLVDDVSTDASRLVMLSLAEQDSRIHLLQHTDNKGAYGARLTALDAATGDFITVHDADDWSHPQKIELQVKALLERPGLKACMSSWCRTTEDLYVLPIGAIPGKGYQRQNESSLMFRRSLVSELGRWDQVRAGADTEFIWRVQAHYGEETVDVVLPEVPLSFSLSQPDSLTQTGPTHVRTIFFGTRQVYRESQKYIHKNLSDFFGNFLDRERTTSYFYAPQRLRGDSTLAVDVLYVADFTKYSPNSEQQLERILGDLQKMRVAVFNWKYFSTPASAGLLDDYLRSAIEGQLEIATADDVVEAKSVVFLDSAVLEQALDRLPLVHCKEWTPPHAYAAWKTTGDAEARS
ncbi:Glycosyl transferase family 2 [Marinospirillum celere]|uniref:Glycosyl transferase family 2 n=1 Tax=Marinospirillum celere TaxID=1122252 RepID=A0A1I1E9J9_9GAMM|nr:glycosyltransferase family A protein [Marinospirillum celere]SFB83747.1 Glycosyl transferase family 2 [Marinospirillum celere]